MNSNDKNFDWHKVGVWMVHDKDGAPQMATIAATPYGARAETLRILQQPWDKLVFEGFSIQQYVPAIPTLTDEIKVGEDVTTAAVSFWRYPAAGHAAPAGSTVWLLTRGGVSVRGIWNDLGDYIAWAPMLQRDKELEARLGL